MESVSETSEKFFLFEANLIDTVFEKATESFLEDRLRILFDLKTGEVTLRLESSIRMGKLIDSSDSLMKSPSLFSTVSIKGPKLSIFTDCSGEFKDSIFSIVLMFPLSKWLFRSVSRNSRALSSSKSLFLSLSKFSKNIID